jgi:hypothetical protein
MNLRQPKDLGVSIRKRAVHAIKHTMFTNLKRIKMKNARLKPSQVMTMVMRFPSQKLVNKRKAKHLRNLKRSHKSHPKR